MVLRAQHDSSSARLSRLMAAHPLHFAILPASHNGAARLASLAGRLPGNAELSAAWWPDSYYFNLSVTELGSIIRATPVSTWRAK